MGLEAQSIRMNVESVDAGAAEGDGPAFEQLLQELEALVTQLESGDLPLNEALQTFERGVRLTRECQAALSAAQQKVQLLLQRGEQVVIEELDRGAIESGTAAAPPDGTA